MNKTNKLSDIIAKQAENENMTELGDKVLEEFSKINSQALDNRINHFMNGSLRTEINKVLSLRITDFQDSIIKELAKRKNCTVKQLILESLLVDIKKENLL